MSHGEPTPQWVIDQVNQVLRVPAPAPLSVGNSADLGESARPVGPKRGEVRAFLHATDDLMQTVLASSAQLDAAIHASTSITELLWLAKRAQILVDAFEGSVSMALARADRQVGR